MTRRWWIGRASIGALAVAAAVVPVPASVVERWYSRGIYPPIQYLLTALTNRLPLALLDVLIIAALIYLIGLSWSAIAAARRQRRATPLGVALVRLATAAAAIYLLFLVLWGMNYRRIAMPDRLVLAAAPPAAEDVMRLGREAVVQMNERHDEAHRVGWRTPEVQDAMLRQAFAQAQAALVDGSAAAPGRLKTMTLLGRYFTWTSVDGMVNPFGLEVLANPDLLPFERPFVAAHEWSHLAGFADESEANFVGWLTCIRGAVPAQYSGWMYLYWQISGEVGAADRGALWAAMAPGPRRDVEDVIARIRRGALPSLRLASWLVYDQYLKANRVEEGVRSYGAVVTLILRTRFEPEWVPVRKR